MLSEDNKEMKYTYTTKIKDGVKYRYRCWMEDFVDQDTDKVISVKRHRLIKIDGQRVYWNPTKRNP